MRFKTGISKFCIFLVRVGPMAELDSFSTVTNLSAVKADISRREMMLSAGLALLLSGGRSSSEVMPKDDSLNALAKKRGRFFGTAVRTDKIWNDPAYRTAVIGECGSITPEVALKWDFVEPQEGELTFDPMNSIMGFAEANDLDVHGHTLLWYNSMPPWAARKILETRDWTIINNHFANVLRTYKGKIKYWDVINEPIEAGKRWDGLRDGVMLQAFGPDYIDHALRSARIYAPDAKLMINDFGFEYDTYDENDRRWLLLRLVEKLKKAGAPLDGIGLQAHLDLAKGSLASKKIADFLVELRNFGVKIIISELDVKEYDYALPAEQRDQRVADHAKQYLEVVLAEPAVIGLTCWGLTDRYSWLDATDGDYKRLRGPREQTGLNRGLPYDANYGRKPLYYTIRNALNA